MLKVVTLEDFIEHINTIMTRDECDLIEAVIAYAEEWDVEYDALVPFINASFKDSIRIEAENKNMMKRNDSQLPL